MLTTLWPRAQSIGRRYTDLVESSFPTVSARSIQPLLARLTAVGIDVDSLLRESGIDSAMLNDAETRIPHASAVTLWRKALQRSGDPALGLHAAETLRPGAFDVLDYAARSCASLGDAWECLCRYQRLFHDGAVLRLSIEGELAHLSHELPASLPALPRPIADFVLAGWAVTARQMTGIELAMSVAFRHAKPDDVSEYSRVFRGPFQFSAPFNRVTVPSVLLATPLVRADPGLCAVLERHVREVLARLPEASASFAVRVRELLAAQLCGGEPTADAIARKLHMSARTLHRRLADENSAFHLLLEDLRKDLAVRHLSERSVGVAEVAFLLGFSEASAFHRAFKRWTGSTPSEYRRSVGSLV